MRLEPPMNDAVRWNADEKIIGVVGVAPVATADFYKKMIELTPVKKDWEHVRIIIDSNPKIPSRGRYLELGETDPVPFIRQTIEKLYEMGASIIAVPCNTAHILYQNYTKNFSMVNIINMIEATVDSAIETIGRIPQRAAVFASALTQSHQLYNNVLRNRGGNTLDTSQHQAVISALIEDVKQGKSIPLLQKKLQEILAHYTDTDVFILGCTELSLLIQDTSNQISVIDSNTALAKACLAVSYNDAFARLNVRSVTYV